MWKVETPPSQSSPISQSTHNRFFANNTFSGNITHNEESTTIGNFKPEWCGTPLVQKNNSRQNNLNLEEMMMITRHDRVGAYLHYSICEAVCIGQKNSTHTHTHTHTHNPVGEHENKRYTSILSLTSALDVGGWSTPRPARFAQGK